MPSTGGLFNPQRTEDQELAVERLEAILALVEGWVSLVAEQATQNLPTAPQLAETLVRRRIEGGPTERVFETLVGLEIRPRWCVRHRIFGAPMRRSTDMRPAMNCGQRRRLCRPPLSLKTPMPMSTPK